MADALLEQTKKNFEYNHWANDRFVKALQEMATPPEKAVQIFAHMIFALDVWLARLEKEDLSRFTNPNPSYTLAECRQKLDELHEKWTGYLASLKPEDLKQKVRYTNTQGKAYEGAVQDLLQQVTCHSPYHRGQLATLVAQNGGKRPNTDYYGYVMETGDVKSL